MVTRIEKIDGQVPGHRLFFACAMVFVASLVIANTIAVKIVSVGELAVAGGILVFPLSYIFGDVLTEVYGYRQTKKVIWLGFVCLALMSAFYYSATLLKPAPFFQNEAAFDSIFVQVPRIVAASLAGYLVGSFLNSIVLSKLKVLTGGRFLWMRTIASTIVGELGDSFLFAFVAFGGVYAMHEVQLIAITGFALKTAYEVAATPVTYIIVSFLKRVEGVDAVDRGERYSVVP